MAGKPQAGRTVALTVAERVQQHRQRRAADIRRLEAAMARVAEARTVAEARRIAQDALRGCPGGG